MIAAIYVRKGIDEIDLELHQILLIVLLKKNKDEKFDCQNLLILNATTRMIY